VDGTIIPITPETALDYRAVQPHADDGGNVQDEGISA
jgi:hypothetical protein